MSAIQLGTRATLSGRRVIVVGKGAFLTGEQNWHVRWPSGDSRTGWAGLTVAEGDLSDPSTPTWEVGDEVLVGWSPLTRKGTVTEVGTDGPGRTVYRIDIEQLEEVTEGGVRWLPGTTHVTVGPEQVDTRER